MRKLFLAGVALLATCTAMAQWKPVEGRIMTSWAEEINPENVLAEYPRPQMVRSEWQNLNGMWEYAIAPRGEKPEAWTARYSFLSQWSQVSRELVSE